MGGAGPPRGRQGGTGGAGEKRDAGPPSAHGTWATRFREAPALAVTALSGIGAPAPRLPRACARLHLPGPDLPDLIHPSQRGFRSRARRSAAAAIAL